MNNLFPISMKLQYWKVNFYKFDEKSSNSRGKKVFLEILQWANCKKSIAVENISGKDQTKYVIV